MKIITLLRKPLEGSVAENILNHGCGGINIDGCRVAMASEADAAEHRYNCEGGYKRQKNWHLNDMSKGTLAGGWKQPTGEPPQVQGRWPANFILIGDDAVQELDRQSGNRKTTWVSTSHKNNRQGDFLGSLGHPKNQGYNDDGGASRFFKQFKKEDEK